MTTIGKYEIVRELGRGAMGIVYEGLDPVIGRKVAIKTIRFDVLVSERERADAQARFLREARSAGNLSHPCIVTIYDVGEDDGLTYIAMEYVDGESLEAKIARGTKLPLDQVASLIARIGDALDYAHRNGVVHRDIKPANILIGLDDRPKLADFGIARVASSALTQTNAVLGTPFYMAPEQIAGQPVDHRADLFSLGTVLYEMLTRTKPFPGENVTTVIYNIMSAEPRPPRDFDATLPLGFDLIVRTALAKDPASRYQSGRDMSDALRAHMAAGSPALVAALDLGSAASATTQSFQAVAAPPRPRVAGEGTTPASAAARRSAMPLVAAGVILLAAVVAVALWRSGSPAEPATNDGRPAAETVAAPVAPATPALPSESPSATQRGVPASPGPGKGPSASKPQGTSSAARPTAPGKLPLAPVAAPVPVPVPAPPVPAPTGRVYESVAVDEKPRVLTQQPPVYPESARERRLQATVVLKVLVTETGLVSEVRVLRPALADPAFDEAAKAAVRQWTFTPAKKKGQPVACWYNVGVPFQLE